MLNSKDIYEKILWAVEQDKFYNFDLSDEEFQESEPIWEDDLLILTLCLSSVRKRNQNRWIYGSLKFKGYDDIEVRDGSMKIEDLMTIESLRKNTTTFANMLKSCLYTCRAKNLNKLDFSENGYSIQIIKTSAKYVTIEETINAVKFEKRFESLDTLISYITYRKRFHAAVGINSNISPSELEKIEKEKTALSKNSDLLYQNLMNRITDKIPFGDEFKNLDEEVSINNVVISEIGHIIFNVNIGSDFKETASYNDIAGVRINISKETNVYESKDLKNYSILFSICRLIELNSGYFKRWVEISNHLKKFVFKTNFTPVDQNKQPIQQKPIYETALKISTLLTQAKEESQMVSERLPITSVCQADRFIVIEGAPKNRRRCDIVVYASFENSTFEEYRTNVEKERIMDESTQFLDGYFI